MMEAFDRAVVAIFEGDCAGLEAALGTPGLATHRAETGHRTLLQMVACEAQHLPDPIEATRILVEAGSQTTWPLISAAGCDAVPVVATMLEMGVPVDADHEAWTPLDEALYWNNTGIAGYLTEHGASIGRLRRTAGLGDVETTRAFFDGPQLNEDAGPIGTPFEATLTEGQAVDPQHILDHAFVMAANCGQKGAAAELLERGARVNSKPPGYHWLGTALHAAIWRGDTDIVQWLLDQGADPTIRDGLANADAVGWARHHGHHALTRLLEGLR